MNCYFIVGTVAEVERLFSTASYVLADNRKSLTPELFEETVFLKMNHNLWGGDLVTEAITEARNEAAEACIRAHEIHASKNV